MKVLHILVYIFGLQYILLAQNASFPEFPPTNSAGVGFLVSSDETGDQGARFRPSSGTKQVIITSIPYGGKTLSSYVIDFDMEGTFTFTKDASLEIPFNTSVFIEDRITGKVVNLKTSNLYTFKVEELISERFVLHVMDKTERETEVTMR